MLTGKGDAIDRVVGLELGADDYLAKPFELREFGGSDPCRTAARDTHYISGGSTGQRYAFEGWVLDITRRSLKSGKRR